MKNKRLFFLVLLLIVAVLLISCSKNNEYTPRSMKREGIEPYKLSKKEKYLLRSFGMEGNSQIISFKAPKEAISMDINVYRLRDGQNWEIIGGTGISIGKDRQPIDQLIGNLTMELRENYAIDFNVNVGGSSSFKTEEIILDTEIMMSMRKFLQDYQMIELDKEIPVALMVYTGDTSMRVFILQDYFEPSKFEGMDLVQAVTLTFSGE